MLPKFLSHIKLYNLEHHQPYHCFILLVLVRTSLLVLTPTLEKNQVRKAGLDYERCQSVVILQMDGGTCLSPRHGRWALLAS